MTERTRSTGRAVCLPALCALLLALALGAAPAWAERALISTQAVEAQQVPGGGIEDACGVAVSGGTIYVSNYYRHEVDAFSSSGNYLSRVLGDRLDGPCGLAAGPSGALYANDWHQSVSRLLPTEATFDPGEATGVAVDPASGDVYVDDRTHVAVYEPSGAAVMVEGAPLLLGAGSLGDGYGAAFFAGKVYVADAADDEVKVYEAAPDPATPVATIDGSGAPGGGFASLVDAALAVDPANGHLLVTDNLQSGYEHPEAAIDEFDAADSYIGRTARTIVDGEPSGLAFGSGILYATSGNDEKAAVFSFGPYTPSAGLSAPGPSAPADLSSQPAAAETGQQGAGAARATRAGRHGPVAGVSEIVQRGHLRVTVKAAFAPHALPRKGVAPIKVSVGARIASTDGGEPPQLRRMTIAINSEGRFDPTGLPVCRLRDIEPATTANALKACRGSLVGEGAFSASVGLSQQAPFPSQGKIFAFNGVLHGHPAILAHVYGTEPVPTSYTLPFEVGSAKGRFGIVLRASLPQATGNSGNVTGLSLDLGRTFAYRGRRHSYLSAGCPAPSGFPGVVFPFARAKFGFAGGKAVSTTLTRNCRVRG